MHSESEFDIQIESNALDPYTYTHYQPLGETPYILLQAIAITTNLWHIF